MKKMSLKDHLYHQFSLLGKSKENEIEEHLKTNQRDKDIKNVFDREFDGEKIIIPKMDNFADTIWQESKNNDKKIINLRNKRYLRKTGYILSFAAAVAVIFSLGVFKNLFTAKIPKISIQLSYGNAVIEPDNKKIAAGQKLFINRGNKIVTKDKTEIIINLPSKGKISIKDKSIVTLSKNLFKDNKPYQKWYVQKGKVQLSIPSKQYSLFAVSTPQADFTVVGTKFSIEVVQNRTKIKVEKGIVKGQLISNREQTIFIKKEKAYNFTDKKITPLKINQKINTKKNNLNIKERIFLKNGMVITGRIISQTQDRLTVKTPAGILNISRKKIKNVQYLK